MPFPIKQRSGYNGIFKNHVVKLMSFVTWAEKRDRRGENNPPFKTWRSKSP